ncbi:hypothetical protein UG55_110110 [Frankia sp. EI5c]|nr:hypothetical protein UG55_110110 [Frankia sp. EI5c]
MTWLLRSERAHKPLAGRYPRVMPAPGFVRAWPLWVALFALLGLAGAAPNATSARHPGGLAAPWSAPFLSTPRPVDLAAPAAAAHRSAPGRVDHLRSWVEANSVLTGQHPRWEHQLLALGAAVCVLAVSAAWLLAHSGAAGRGIRRAGGGPGSRGPPGRSEPVQRLRPSPQEWKWIRSSNGNACS